MEEAESYYDAQHQRTASFACTSHFTPQQRYPYYDVVVGLAWSNDLKCYAGSGIATGKASHAGQEKRDDPK
jgi:hypothetical protein